VSTQMRVILLVLQAVAIALGIWLAVITYHAVT